MGWGAFGVVYFLSFPGLLVMTQLIVSSHMQHFVMEIGRMLVEGVALYYVAWVSTSKKGAYRDIGNFNLELPKDFGY